MKLVNASYVYHDCKADIVAQTKEGLVLWIKPKTNTYFKIQVFPDRFLFNHSCPWNDIDTTFDEKALARLEGYVNSLPREYFYVIEDHVLFLEHPSMKALFGEVSEAFTHPIENLKRVEFYCRSDFTPNNKRFWLDAILKGEEKGKVAWWFESKENLQEIPLTVAKMRAFEEKLKEVGVEYWPYVSIKDIEDEKHKYVTWYFRYTEKHLPPGSYHGWEVKPENFMKLFDAIDVLITN